MTVLQSTSVGLRRYITVINVIIVIVRFQNYKMRNEINFQIMIFYFVLASVPLPAYYGCIDLDRIADNMTIRGNMTVLKCLHYCDHHFYAVLWVS